MLVRSRLSTDGLGWLVTQHLEEHLCFSAIDKTGAVASVGSAIGPHARLCETIKVEKRHPSRLCSRMVGCGVVVIVQCHNIVLILAAMRTV